MFCNVADNQYFVQAEKRGLQFEGKTRQELIEQRKKYVARIRESYLEFLDRTCEEVITSFVR